MQTALSFVGTNRISDKNLSRQAGLIHTKLTHAVSLI